MILNIIRIFLIVNNILIKIITAFFLFYFILFYFFIYLFTCIFMTYILLFNFNSIEIIYKL